VLRSLQVFMRAVRLIAVIYDHLSTPADALTAGRNDLIDLGVPGCPGCRELRRVCAAGGLLALQGRDDPAWWVEELERQAAKAREVDALEEAWTASPEDGA
jgi:hypothetical protein